MSRILDTRVVQGANVSYIEKNTWLFGVIAITGYAIYVALVLTAADGGPVPEAPYIVPMLSTIGGAIVVGVLGGIVLGIVTRADNRGTPDARDKDIEHTGERVGNSLLVIGAIGALVLAMLEVDHFWIANELYLTFVLTAILSTVTRVVIYRRGF